MMEELTIESLAKAIHEDEAMATKGLVSLACGSILDCSYDDLTTSWKQVRREQARLMLERIMR